MLRVFALEWRSIQYAVHRVMRSGLRFRAAWLTMQASGPDVVNLARAVNYRITGQCVPWPDLIPGVDDSKMPGNHALEFSRREIVPVMRIGRHRRDNRSRDNQMPSSPGHHGQELFGIFQMFQHLKRHRPVKLLVFLELFGTQESSQLARPLPGKGESGFRCIDGNDMAARAGQHLRAITDPATKIQNAAAGEALPRECVSFNMGV